MYASCVYPMKFIALLTTSIRAMEKLWYDQCELSLVTLKSSHFRAI